MTVTCSSAAVAPQVIVTEASVTATIALPSTVAVSVVAPGFNDRNRRCRGLLWILRDQANRYLLLLLTGSDSQSWSPGLPDDVKVSQVIRARSGFRSGLSQMSHVFNSTGN